GAGARRPGDPAADDDDRLLPDPCHVGSALGETELARGARVAVGQELGAAPLLVALADRTGGAGERRERAQEAAVRDVLPRDGPLPSPPGTPQRVEPAVVPGPGVRVGL